MATCLVNPRATRRSSDVTRFPHGAPILPAGVPRQAGARKNLHARGVGFGGRGDVTGDVVTSGVDFVDEGGKNTTRAKKDGYP